MKKIIYKCDLCGAKVDHNRAVGVKIKIKPSYGWEHEIVIKCLDLCEKCDTSILEKIRELENKGEPTV